jgi:hypothetical protein
MAVAEPSPTGAASGASALPADFDVTSWTRAACEASGVPFAVEDPVTLAKLRDLAEHPA